MSGASGAGPQELGDLVLSDRIQTLEARERDLSRALEDECTYALKLQIALTGLSGGGSENFVRHGDGFRADIPFCTQRIRERQNNAFEAVRESVRERKAERARAEKVEADLAAARAEAETQVRQARDDALEEAAGEVERLTRERDAARAVLRRVEWVRDDFGEDFCPECERQRRKDHIHNCALAAQIAGPARKSDPDLIEDTACRAGSNLPSAEDGHG